MKILLLSLFVIGFAFGCSSKDKNPDQPPVIVVPPTPTPTPVPIEPVEGMWCVSGEPDFSPCPPAFDTSAACKLGERKGGACSIYYCKSVCPYAFTLQQAKQKAQMNSSTLKAYMLDGSVQEFVAILPSPRPPGPAPVIEVVELADGTFKLK